MERAKDKECNSAKKLAEESNSCTSKAMSAETEEEEQGASGEASMQNNSRNEAKRKRSMKNDEATCPKKMPQCCSGMKPQKMQIPPLPSILPPANLIHRDVLRAWCQQLKLSTKGRKLDGYKRLCEHAYPNQKDFPATAEEARILSPSRRKLMMDRGELPLEASDKKMSFGGAAPAGGAPALEGAAAHEGVVSTSDTEAVFASWSRIVSEAGRVQAVESRETCEVKWCVVHGRSLPGNTEGWVHLQFHAGQAWVPEKRRRVSALFLLPANTFPPPYLEDNMLCPECVQRNKVLTKSLQ
ncbi:LOW QUALITY PROTEIN: developmental pluripotency-associated protein 4 [Sus scrofa]|uniref:LOW QUALITY PROTEIN: developmental pluripotency-associated protein 4 n=1 Tax=Sus scrofa TaxID=9823 RepID=UPI000A2B3849|nr:LOW QUALITY PROTEIN: developmental pluripotency-associated protein 4 [Sus scrofa]